MQFKEATVKSRYMAKQFLKVRSALWGLLRKPLVKKTQQKIAIKCQKLAFPLSLLDHLEAILKILHIAVKKALALDEINKHQAVEHQ